MTTASLPELVSVRSTLGGSGILRGRNRTKADVEFFDLPSGRIVVKSYASRPWWIRSTLGRWLVARECAAFRAASAGRVRGLPEFLGRVGRHALAMRRVDGVTLMRLEGSPLPRAVFDGLREILDDLHGAGVALGDLHRRNVLVSDDGSVHVVDLAVAWVLGESPGPFRRFVYRRLRDVDEVAFARLRARFLDGREADLVADVGERAARWHRRGRRVKRFVDALRGRRRVKEEPIP